MTTALHYQVLTHPHPLPASTPTTPSTATTYIIITNHNAATVTWKKILVTVPTGDKPKDLTNNPDSIRPGVQGEAHGAQFSRTRNNNIFEAIPGKGFDKMLQGQVLVLQLGNISINASDGLSVLTIDELTEVATTRHASLGILKLPADDIPAPPQPDIPRNFHPEKQLIDTTRKQEPENVKLLWNGPRDAEYTILPDGGTPQEGEQSWSPKMPPARDTTYTLKATHRDKTYYLTTTVHIRKPTYEEGVYVPELQWKPGEPWIHFAEDRVEIRVGQGWSKLSAGTVDTTTVIAEEEIQASKLSATTVATQNLMPLQETE
ncbi:hypothetical protein [Streptomyces zagrosensis]|uniref:Uncharacterized protein n=1 Tax=Streptomyces zagrosensis TaxID=1042984 RepID=A0A7W9QEQ9_9ACTN|nr:hypothetical protein [Streptomyces zagrosensis]MBB5938634.1 hypothetical protein [Streptomyces zagrosensis]